MDNTDYEEMMNEEYETSLPQALGISAERFMELVEGIQERSDMITNKDGYKVLLYLAVLDLPQNYAEALVVGAFMEYGFLKEERRAVANAKTGQS